MVAELKIEVPGRFDALPEAMDQVSRWLEAQAVTPAASYLALLALEELVTNCIKYGLECPERHRIGVSMRVAGRELVMDFTDDGKAFNPLEAPEPDTSLPLEDREAGGLGIHLLRRIADHAGYARVDGRNHLTLRKSLD